MSAVRRTRGRGEKQGQRWIGWSGVEKRETAGGKARGETRKRKVCRRTEGMAFKCNLLQSRPKL